MTSAGVGAVQSKKRIDDGKWHDVAMTWEYETGRVRFFIDGKQNGTGILRPQGKKPDLVAKIGFTNGNFPGNSFFDGDIKQVQFFSEAIVPDVISQLRKERAATTSGHLVGDWVFGVDQVDQEKVPDRSSHEHHLTRISDTEQGESRQIIVAGVIGETECEFLHRKSQLHLRLPAQSEPHNLIIWTASVAADTTESTLADFVMRVEDQLQIDPVAIKVKQQHPPRWPEIVATEPMLGHDDGPFAVDDLAAPMVNPWLCRIRLTGHDFFANGDEVAVCSWDGDVWLVRGLKTLESADGQEPNPKLTWQRIASGLFQPLGVKIVDDVVYVTCRDQIVILRDHDGDRETDYYECFNNDHQVTDHFHEFAMGLQRDQDGNFYYAKSARHALTALVPHHGTLLKVSPDGEQTEIIANGFRAANGVCLNPDGSFIVTDQEGHWNPKNRINWVTKGGFYGNMFGYHDVTDDSDEAMDQPLCWITNAFDRSPSELLWVDSEAWGGLHGRLLNLSYGYGKVYVVPHENVSGQMQGGMCAFPIPQFPTGTCRGRFHDDGGLYLSGMFAWGSSQQSRDGGFYRIRKTSVPAYLPVQLNAQQNRVVIEFSDQLDPESAVRPDNYEVTTWDLKRSARYGSDHYNEKTQPVTGVRISDDASTIVLEIPGLAPTWGMEIRCRLKTVEGATVERVIHNTIHNLAPRSED